MTERLMGRIRAHPVLLIASLTLSVSVATSMFGAFQGGPKLSIRDPSAVPPGHGPCEPSGGTAPHGAPSSDVCSGAGRSYLNGVYADPADSSTPALMGYPWDYTTNYSYQDNKPGGGVFGLYSSELPAYPMIIDLFHVNTTYNDFQAAADGNYNAYYQRTARSLLRRAQQIYAVRIDSEFNGSWSPWKPFGEARVSTKTWIAGFRNLVMAVRQALPEAKIIWNPAVGQNDPFPYYPGDDVVDLVGPDVYCQPQYHRSSAACWTDMVEGLDGINLTAFAEFARQHGKPMVIPEWADSFGDGYMIGHMREWMDANNVVAQSYWDSGDALSRSASLPGLTTNQQAYVAAFGHRAYVGNYWPRIIPITKDVRRRH